QPEMEFALALVVVFAARGWIDRLPRSVQAALALFALAIAGEQFYSHRQYAKEILKPADRAGSIEARVARWVDENLPGQRVMVPGSIAQWFNVFSSAPQLSGGSYSTTPNWNQQEAMSSVLAGRDAGESILWLKAFGVQAVTVVGAKSQEFWKPYADPKKFDGILPVLWQFEDTTIYRVPQRSASLAHVVPAGSLEDLGSYVAALDEAERR